MFIPKIRTMQQAANFSSIKIVYYSDKDRLNYEKLFALLKCKTIVSFERADDFWMT